MPDGAAPSRLAGPVEAGLVHAVDHRHPGRRTRKEYLLTPAGQDLRPVLLALLAFGHRTVRGRAADRGRARGLRARAAGPPADGALAGLPPSPNASPGVSRS